MVAEALRHAEPYAPASLYDVYAERLHDYACSLAREEHAAARAVHDALVTAHESVARLGDPGRFRAWMYALTRFQCAIRARGLRTPPYGTATRGEAREDAFSGWGAEPYGGPGEVTGDGPATRYWELTEEEFEEGEEDGELVELVRDVLEEIEDREREALWLVERHGLTAAEAGAVLGISSRQVVTLVGKARERLEGAAAAVLLARNGRAHCPDLSAMLDSWEGPLTPVLRRRLTVHIGRCEVCTERRRKQVAVGALLDLVPVAYPPIPLRSRVIETCSHPDRERTRKLIAQRLEHVDKKGFPVVAVRRSRRRRTHRPRPVLIAAICLLTATGAVAVVSGRGGGEPGTASDVRAAPPGAGLGEEPGIFTPEPEEVPPLPEEPAIDDLSEEPSPDEAEISKEPSPSPAPVAIRTRPAPRPTPSRPRPTPRPAAAMIVRFSAACPGDLGETGAGRIRVSARGRTLSWNATTSGGLVVQPRSGRLRAGASAGVWVAAEDPMTAGSGTVSFTSTGGSTQCSVSWSGREGGDLHEPPSDPPSPPEESAPSASPSQETGDSPAS